jgi:hypothetical protein
MVSTSRLALLNGLVWVSLDMVHLTRLRVVVRVCVHIAGEINGTA